MLTIDTASPEAQISIFVLFALGSMVGLLGGFFGVGGGWIITPTLNILGMPMPYAIGTGLAYIMGMSFISVLKHGTSNTVDPVLGIALGITMMAGIQAGKSAVMAMEDSGIADPLIRSLYILLLLALGLFMLHDSLRVRRCPGAGVAAGKRSCNSFVRRLRLRPMLGLKVCDIRVSLWPLAAVGLAIGFFSGILGAGGGFLIVPALIYLVGTPTIVAVGTSLLCILIASPFGTAVYALAGRVNFPAAGIMLAGVVVCAPLGVRAAHAVKGVRLRLLYAIMILCGGASVLLKELDSRLELLLLRHSSKILIFVAGGGIALAILLLWLQTVRKTGKGKAASDGERA